MKARLFFVFTFLIILFTQSVVAQDIIVKKDSILLKCKIKEIGLDEVKYTLPEYSEDVIFAIDKDNISKIVFENGKEMSFQKEITNPDNYKDNKKNALKINFLSPLFGSTSFSYERSLRPGRSMEGTLGIIGLGNDIQDENPGGAFVKFGYKFIKDPDFYLRGMRYSHILKGAYFKPEIGFSAFGRDNYSYMYYSGQSQTNNSRETVISGTLQIVMGKQWIVNNAFLIDFYAGVGYGFSNSEYTTYHYSGWIAENSFPISFSTGLKIGFLFQ